MKKTMHLAGILAVSVLALLVQSCAGYDDKFSLIYADPSGYSAGGSVEILKLPKDSK